MNSQHQTPLKASPMLFMNYFSLIKSLDFVFWSMLTFYFAMLVMMQDIFILSVPYIIVLPLFTLLYGCLKLPEAFLESKEWQTIVVKFRYFSLITAFMFPFVIFIQLSEKNTYFALCCGLAIFAIMQILISISQVCRQVSLYLKEDVLASESKLAIRLIYVFAFIVIIMMVLYILDSTFIRELHQRGLLDAVFKLAILFLVFPLVFPMTLLFRLKSALLKSYKQEVKKYE